MEAWVTDKTRGRIQQSNVPGPVPEATGIVMIDQARHVLRASDCSLKTREIRCWQEQLIMVRCNANLANAQAWKIREAK